MTRGIIELLMTIAFGGPVAPLPAEPQPLCPISLGEMAG